MSAGAADAGRVGAGDQPDIIVRHRGLLTFSVMLAAVTQVLDSTIANIALPHMQAALGATQENIVWVLTSYIMATAVTIPLSGWLTAQLGIRRLFLLSMALFMIASALCGLATSLPQMVAFRILQGIGGACMTPLAQTVMLNTHTPAERPRAMALYMAGLMIGPIAGPVLGGWLTEAVSWRWVFYINLPIALLCMFGLWALLPDMPAEKRRFDLSGWLLLSVALAALQLMLDRGGHLDWFESWEIRVEAIIFVGATWMFIVHSLTRKDPLFAPAMLRDANFVAGTTFTFLLSMVMMVALALLPVMLQTIYNMPVIDAGEATVSRGFGIIVATIITGRLAFRVDPRVLGMIGFLLTAASMWDMSRWSLDTDWWAIFNNCFLQGLGNGLIFGPLNALIFGTLAAQYRTDGASLFSLMRNVGGSIGIAFGTALLARNMQVSHADLAAHITPYNLPVDPSLLGAYGAQGQAALAMIDGMVMREAAMIAYIAEFRVMMVATLVALPLLLLIRPLKLGAPPPPPIHAD